MSQKRLFQQYRHKADINRFLRVRDTPIWKLKVWHSRAGHTARYMPALQTIGLMKKREMAPYV